MNNDHSPRRAALLCSFVFSCSAILLVIASLAEDEEQTPSKIEAAIKSAGDKYKNLNEGKNAKHTSVPAKVDSNILGIILVTTDGKLFTCGDVKSAGTIQSTRKGVVMAKVREKPLEETGNRFRTQQAIADICTALQGDPHAVASD